MENKQELSFASLRTIYWMLLFGQVLFFLVVSFVLNLNNSEVSEETRRIFLFLVPIVVIFSSGLGLAFNLVIATKLKDEPNLKIRFKKFATSNVIGWACIEGSTLICIIGYLITGLKLYQIMALVVILFFLLTIPTKDRVANGLNLSENEKQLLK
jgi:hypothetical protein